jgi:hypothetical protein
MKTNQGTINSIKPRICMLTTRNFNHKVFRSVLYESEDILLEVDDVELINLIPARAYQLKENVHKKIIWHDFTKNIICKNIAYKTVRLTKEYDLFVAYCADIYDLLYISAIRGWKDQCRTSICWIDELWAKNALKYDNWLWALSKFDHIVLGLSGTAKVVSNALGRQCHFLPSAVDAIRFCPFPHPPVRVIDVYNYGRIWQGIHHSMQNLAADKKIFYIYDTIHVSDAQTKDYRQHRDLVANIAKRSRFIFVAPAKMNVPEEINGQIEIGARYYEASASGAVMLGQVPDCEVFYTMFDWPDVVIPIQPDGSDVKEVLSSLSTHPERLQEISRRNVFEALLRHDWVYRWRNILDIAGIKPAPALEAREWRLKMMAEQIQL